MIKRWDIIKGKIDNLINERKITQKWIAEKMNTDPGLVSRWLSNEKIPRERTIDKLLKIFEEAGFKLLEEEKTNVDLSSIKPLTGENVIKLPILADIPAGLPEYGEKDVEFFWDVPRFLFSWGRFRYSLHRR